MEIAKQRHGLAWAAGTVLVAVMMALALAGCGSSAATSDAASDSESETASGATSQATATSEAATASEAASEATTTLEPGVYTVDFDTNDNMFKVNETKDGKAELTVADDGSMILHVVLAGKGIINVYPGPVDEAEQDGAQLIDPTTETVTYDDGISEEAYAFDIPVPAIDQDFTVSIIGNHGNWYEHTCRVTNPVPEE